MAKDPTGAERQARFRARRKAEREKLISSVEELTARLAEVKPDMPPEAWDALAEMPAADLARWVKVGQRMASRGHDDPVWNAIRWIEGN